MTTPRWSAALRRPSPADHAVNAAVRADPDVARVWVDAVVALDDEQRAAIERRGQPPARGRRRPARGDGPTGRGGRRRGGRRAPPPAIIGPRCARAATRPGSAHGRRRHPRCRRPGRRPVRRHARAVIVVRRAQGAAGARSTSTSKGRVEGAAENERPRRARLLDPGARPGCGRASGPGSRREHSGWRTPRTPHARPRRRSPNARRAEQDARAALQAATADLRPRPGGGDACHRRAGRCPPRRHLTRRAAGGPGQRIIDSTRCTASMNSSTMSSTTRPAGLTSFIVPTTWPTK